MAETQVGRPVGIGQSGIRLGDEVFQQGDVLVAGFQVDGPGIIVERFPKIGVLVGRDQVVEQRFWLVIVIAAEEGIQLVDEGRASARELGGERSIGEDTPKNPLIINESLIEMSERLEFDVIGLESAPQVFRRARGRGHRQAGMRGTLVEPELRILFLQAQAEGTHTDDAARSGRHDGVDLTGFAEHFGELVVHPGGDPLVLLPAQRSQVARIDERDRIEGLELPVEILAPGRQFPGLVCGREDFVEQRIGFGIPGIAGAVSAVMADIKRFVTLGSRRGRRDLETVRAFHSRRFAGVGFHLIQHIILLGAGHETDEQQQRG